MNAYTIKLVIFLTGIISFVISFLSIPTILRVAHSKNLFDEPNRRNVHKYRIPTLGGLAIFISFLFTYSLVVDWFKIEEISFMVPALIVIFGIGIKDDILVTAPIVKLIGQLIAAFIIVGLGDVRITDLHGFIPIKLDYFGSVVLSVVVVVAIINGFNLIDGVDGLAAFVGITSIIPFSIWFYINGDNHIPILCAAFVGALLAFIYFNVFSIRQKIFMGDTGSMLLGFVLSVVAIRFLELNIPDNRSHLAYSMNSAPAVAMGVLIVPIVDTVRVFIIRISKGRSPFTADKNHIHHRLLTLGFSHLKISLLLAFITVIFSLLSFLLRNLGVLKLTMLLTFLSILLAYIPSLAIAYQKRKLRN